MTSESSRMEKLGNCSSTNFAPPEAEPSSLFSKSAKKSTIPSEIKPKPVAENTTLSCKYLSSSQIYTIFGSTDPCVRYSRRLQSDEETENSAAKAKAEGRRYDPILQKKI